MSCFLRICKKFCDDFFKTIAKTVIKNVTLQQYHNVLQTQNELQYFIGDTKLKLLNKNLVYKNNKE